jgi:hypothetical protein
MPGFGQGKFVENLSSMHEIILRFWPTKGDLDDKQNLSVVDRSHEKGNSSRETCGLIFAVPKG